MNKQEVLQYFEKHFGDRYISYPSSIKFNQNDYFFMAKDDKEKYLVIFAVSDITRKFTGKVLEERKSDGNEIVIKICSQNHYNLNLLREMFPHLNPSFCGLQPSFGTGDRLGIVTPAHILAFNGKDLFPILAQQSVREMARTERNWERVLDDAIWGSFEVGYEGPFGADADHVKKIEELKEAVDCGYTMFTLDPSDYIRKDVLKLSEEEKRNFYRLNSARKELENLYLQKTYIFDNQKLIFDENSLAEFVLLYSDALKHLTECAIFLKGYKKDNFDLEVSIDETPNVTSPLAHLFVVLELKRRGVVFQNLALHFLGDWQKGIDYIGDVEEFSREFSLHADIAKQIGGYKLSLHSGSDKFSVYPIFAQKTEGLFHIKTAGTSWLEAVKVIAMKDPELYREIHQFALKNFEKDRASYNLTTDVNRIPDISKLSNGELVQLFSGEDFRQLIHITYGSILRAKDSKSKSIFKGKIYQILFQNEEEHYREVAGHIRRHLELLASI